MTGLMWSCQTALLMLQDSFCGAVCCWNQSGVKKGDLREDCIILHMRTVRLSSSAVSLVHYIPTSIHFTIARSPSLYTQLSAEDKCGEDDSQDDSMSGTVPESRTHFQAELP